MLGRSKDLMSMPIISLEEGQQIGKVRGMVVDPENHKIAALVTDKQSWFGDYKVVPFADVTSVGDHAVTIDNKANIEKPSNIPEISKLMKTRLPLLGAKVISETGTLLGIVDDFIFERETGDIQSLEISGRFVESLFRGRNSLPVSNIVTIGSDAIIVRTTTAEDMTKVESSVQKRLGSARTSVGKLFGTTKKKTRKLSDSLTSSIEKFTGDKEDPPKTNDSDGEKESGE